MFKGAIFDLDGTLIDSMGEWKTVGGNYLRSKGITYEDNVDKILESMSLEEAARYFVYNYGFEMKVDEIIKDINSFIKYKYQYEFPLKKGTREYLQKLKKNNIKMCIATMTDSSLAELALKRLKIDNYFDFILSCSEIGYNKSYPNIYLECGKRLNLNINEIMVFEDSIQSIKTAKEAGFYVIGVNDMYQLRKDLVEKNCNRYILDFYELI